MKHMDHFSLKDKTTLATGLTPSEMAKGVRWLASRPLEEQAIVLQYSFETHLPRLLAEAPANHSHGSHYVALILAIREAGFDLIRKRGYRIASKKEFEKYDALRQGTMQSLRAKRQAPLRMKTLSLWGEVRRLKQEGNGFLLISRYLSRAHAMKVSPSYLAKLWSEVES